MSKPSLSIHLQPSADRPRAIAWLKDLIALAEERERKEREKRAGKAAA